MVAWIPYEADFRAPSAWEQAILGRLLEIAFPGRDELREQVSKCIVRALSGPGDHEGSIEIVALPQVSAPVTSSVPVVGVGYDSDGMDIDFLLHVREGLLSELEVVRADGDPITKLPEPNAISVSPFEDFRRARP